MDILNKGDEIDADDRCEIQTINGQKVDIALLGNRKSGNPASEYDHQYDRLAVMSLPPNPPEYEIPICDHVMQSVMKQRHTLREMEHRSTITMAAYDPKTSHLSIHAYGDSPAFLILDDGNKIKAIRLAPRDQEIYSQEQLCYSEPLTSEVPYYATKLFGLNGKTVKAGLLVASDGIMDAQYPHIDASAATLPITETQEAQVEQLYRDAKASMDADQNLGEAIARMAIKNGSKDNISLVWMPDMLANREENPIIACVCDTPGEGQGAQQLIEVFQAECAKTHLKTTPTPGKWAPGGGSGGGSKSYQR